MRRLALDDMNTAARVHRAAFDDALPWLAGLHTPEEDAWFYRERMFVACEVWSAFSVDALVGVVAFRAGWIDQLYVLRAAGSVRRCCASHRRRRTGSRSGPSSATRAARRFYEARGFRPIRETDGAGNEEKEPDVLYLWARFV